MPRKSKVSAVPIDQPEGIIVAQTEEKTDAEQMTELVKAVESEPVHVENDVDSVPKDADGVTVEPDVEAKPKAKAKRAPRAKKEEPLPEPNVEVQSSTINEVVVEVDLDAIPNMQTKQKASDKVECPDCGKQMSAKTLRYSHGPNCLFKKQADKEEAKMNKIPDDVIEAEVQKRMSNAKADRLQRRQKQIESLVANAFP